MDKYFDEHEEFLTMQDPRALCHRLAMERYYLRKIDEKISRRLDRLEGMLRDVLQQLYEKKQEGGE